MDINITPHLRKVVPAPTLEREVGPDEVRIDTDGFRQTEMDPKKQAVFDRMDALTKGMTPEQIRTALFDMYQDADGVLCIPLQQIRAVPDPD